MFKTVFELGINLVETLITINFITCYLGRKYSGVKEKVCFISAWIALFLELSIVNYITPFENSEVLIHLAVCVVYALICLNGGFLLKVWICVLIEIILTINAVIVNLFICYIIDYDPNEMITVFNTTRIITVIIVQTLLFCITRLILKHKYKTPIKAKTWLLLVIIPLISLFSLYALMMAAMGHKEIRGYILFGVFSILISNVVTYFFFKSLSRSYETQLRIKLLEQHNENAKQALTNTEAYVKQIRSFRHDANNQFTVIYNLIGEKKYDEAQKYIKNLVNNHLPDFQQYITTDNDAFDAIINSKIAVCHSKKIFAEIKVQEHSLDNFDAVDIGILFGNLLDNAIEASESTQNRHITVDVRVRGTYLSIIVANSITHSVLSENDELETSKTDKSIHGIGIKNIKSIVKKYDGMIQFDEQDNEFICHILLDTH